MIDTQTYNNFKAANPGLEPDARDYANMAGTGPDVITSESLAPTKPLNLASTPQDTTNYGAISSSIPTYDEIIKQIQTPTQAETDVTKSQGGIRDLIGRITGMGGSVGTDGSINTDIAKNNAIEDNIKRFGYVDSVDAYKQLTDVNNQLSGLKKEATAIPLKIQQDFAGRGATSGGVAPIQTAQLRENAIKSLGLASIAETIQGNISTAANLAERAVNIQFAPVEAELKAQMFNYNMNKDALERADKKKADALKITLDERARQLDNAKEDKKIIYGWSAEAAKNGAPALLISRAQQSSNPSEALSILSQYMSDPNAKAQALATLELTRANTAKVYADTAETNARAAKTKAETATLGGVSASQQQKDLTLVNNINNVLSDINFNDAFGLGGYINRNRPGSAAKTVEANVQQIIDQLALAARGQLKGQGAVSDFEGQMLKNAQTALNFGLSPEAAKQQLINIRGAITTSSGGVANIKITNPKTGETSFISANSNGITNAIKDGMRVEYTQ